MATLAPGMQDFLKALASETCQRILLLFSDGAARAPLKGRGASSLSPCSRATGP